MDELSVQNVPVLVNRACPKGKGPCLLSLVLLRYLAHTLVIVSANTCVWNAIKQYLLLLVLKYYHDPPESCIEYF